MNSKEILDLLGCLWAGGIPGLARCAMLRYHSVTVDEIRSETQDAQIKLLHQTQNRLRL